ncbi:MULTISPECIES: tyrosine-type recombinase/integrase [Gordonia]|uniref:Integrase n=2 Tax=Gordonia TaxID=2053 RepID=A0ABR5I901_9ACTN|nr:MULTISPECIES: tyrosine-type recombinase/integrase [Gordonia]KNA90080.1 integrase [Gordonia jacobaea]GAC50609.1 putative recombinase [Gordonia aichiensis NBRC 108223]
MATIESYTTKSGKRYRVRYRTPDHRQTDKRGFRTKRDAEAFAATVELEKLTGSYVAPTLGRITVSELAPDWLSRKESDVAPSNYRTLESAWRTHVEPKWGRRRIADIELGEVERWIADLGRTITDAKGEVVKKGAGATTIIRAYGVLAGILDDAVKSRRLAVNPARGVENLPKKGRKRHVYLSASDVERLAVESGEHRALVLTLAYCGLRWGELVALRVRDVEFLRKRLTVHDNAVQLGVEHAVGRTKSRKTRSVPVPQFILDELSVQCQGKDLDELVFPGPNGRYLPRPKSTRGWFAGAVQRAGVQTITPHDLRHTTASLAVSAGVNVLALARMLGHTSAKVTLDVYADLFDDDLDAVAVTLNQRYSPQSVGKVWAEGTTDTSP